MVAVACDEAAADLLGVEEVLEVWEAGAGAGGDVGGVVDGRGAARGGEVVVFCLGRVRWAEVGGVVCWLTFGYWRLSTRGWRASVMDCVELGFMIRMWRVAMVAGFDGLGSARCT